MIFALTFGVWLNFAPRNEKSANAGTPAAAVSAPTLSQISPNESSISGGETITIKGGGFSREWKIDLNQGAINQAARRDQDSAILAGGGYNNSDAISLIGTNGSAPYTDTNHPEFINPDATFFLSDFPNWSIEMDFTEISSLTFYAKMASFHGQMAVCLDGTDICSAPAQISQNRGQRLLYVIYQSMPTAWKKYTIDFSQISGIHTLYFVGGYSDNVSNIQSETQYSDVTFIRKNPTVEIGGTPCANLQIVSDSEMTCEIPPHATGNVNLTMKINGENLTLPFTYVDFCEYNPELLASDENCKPKCEFDSAIFADDERCVASQKPVPENPANETPRNSEVISPPNTGIFF